MVQGERGELPQRGTLRDVDFVVIDTETTGMRPGPDRVIEIGAVRIHNGVIADTFQSLINP